MKYKVVFNDGYEVIHECEDLMELSKFVGTMYDEHGIVDYYEEFKDIEFSSNEIWCISDTLYKNMKNIDTDFYKVNLDVLMSKLCAFYGDIVREGK